MQKKNALLAEDDDADALEDAVEVAPEVDGVKEPTHSEMQSPVSVILADIDTAVAVAGAADGIDIVEDDGLQVSVPL